MIGQRDVEVGSPDDDAGFNWSWITGRDVEVELRSLGSSTGISNEMANVRERPASAGSSWNSWLSAAKGKLYNMVSAYPQQLPTFTSSPIWMLGKQYRIPSQQDPTDYAALRPYVLPLIVDTVHHSSSASQSSPVDSSSQTISSSPFDSSSQTSSSSPFDSSSQTSSSQTSSSQTSSSQTSSNSSSQTSSSSPFDSSSQTISSSPFDSASSSSPFDSSSQSPASELSTDADTAKPAAFHVSQSQPPPLSAVQEGGQQRRSLSEADFDLMATTATATRQRDELSVATLQPPSSPPGATTEEVRVLRQPTGRELQTMQTKAVQRFLDDFASRIWFTYRSNFARIRPSQLTTDLGWGCMVRTAQMMVAQAFVVHFLGRHWTLRGSSMPEDDLHTQIIRWFGDTPSPLAPYSIHNVTRLGARFNKKIGECFEPSQVARCFKILVRKHHPGNMTMYAPREPVLCRADVRELCTRGVGGGDEAWRPLIVMLSVRLGPGERLTPVYIPGLKFLLTLPQSLGVIGGRPNQSLWFVGHQDDAFFYFDPHLVQDAVDPDAEPFDSRSYHWKYPQKMPCRDVDPSMAIGFYCRGQLELDDLCARIHQHNDSSRAPIISVVDAQEETCADQFDEDQYEGFSIDI